ncbi:phage protein NinX family protein [Caballeronia zhejiangensis]|uniref:DUF2591 domain-containing protein n=1 Tax=Caballeronia zhejiangensis TaxID=871203 RepID=A0A656QC20_9BURK|nr:phage protein NinX family protein [Caballeronia zhejiangensis]KDR25944.1 hypothetical protein BG60_26310 [Caballeronia zhejiangensis]
MKVSELTGDLLDMWVAKAQGRNVRKLGDAYWDDDASCAIGGKFGESASTDWAVGGPIIEREKIGVTVGVLAETWFALRLADGVLSAKPVVRGATPLVAAMRAFVTSKFGEEVPEE